MTNEQLELRLGEDQETEDSDFKVTHGGKINTIRTIVAIPKWRPGYLTGNLRYWIKSYCEINGKELPENFNQMHPNQLYAIYRNIQNQYKLTKKLK